MTLLDRIHYLIQQEGTTERAITEKLGISVSSFTDWRKGKGKPSLDTVVKLANHFGVSLDWLVLGAHDDIFSATAHSPSEKELLDKFGELPDDYKLHVFSYVDYLLTKVNSGSMDDIVDFSIIQTN